MAYTINLTDGTVLATVADGTINTDATNIKLVGKNFTGYGEILNENYVHMLENFSSTTAPTTPLNGQIWWNSSIGVLNVYDGSQFKAVSSSTVAASEPSGAVEGDLWWNSLNDQLHVYNGTAWVLIGPSFAAGSGQSGAIVEIIADSGLTDHVVVSTYVADTVVAITSKDAVFTPNTTITGFTNIRPGINLVSDLTITGARYTGTATDSDALEGITAAQFLRSDVADATSETLSVQHDNGIRIGVGDDLQLNVVAGDEVEIFNRTAGAGMQIGTTALGGTSRPAFTIDGTTGDISLQSVKIIDLLDPTSAQDATTKAYVDLVAGVSSGGGALFSDGSVAMTGNFLPSLDGTFDMGSTILKFSTIHASVFSGTATEAAYADLAERFEIDLPVPAGTVVTLGGMAEITKTNEELSEDIFGVISTQPGYLMNAKAGTNESHPPVAMSGRVPVRVVGEVKKGDRLVSAGNGLARAATKDELTSFNVIGRALEDKYTTEESVLEAIVNMNS
jgi:hypothetical protein